jgi:hypothetical protein
VSDDKKFDPMRYVVFRHLIALGAERDRAETERAHPRLGLRQPAST